jgi:Reverse transcriptase (RNA-dependent DNA polymerase)
MSCVRWGSMYSSFVNLSCGVHQGGVLSPVLFAIYVDDIITDIDNKKLGCHISGLCCGIFLYADDILLLSVSVVQMQEMLDVCQNRFEKLDMIVNANKSICIRIGNRYDKQCAQLMTKLGPIAWGTELKYLGVYFVASRKCCFNLAVNKSKFYRSLNGILVKIGTKCSPGVSLALIASYCVPCLTYGLAAMSLTKSETASIEHSFDRAFMKIFASFDIKVIRACQFYSGYLTMAHQIDIMKLQFLKNVDNVTNSSMSRILHSVLLKRQNINEYELIAEIYNIDAKDSIAACKVKVWSKFANSLCDI